MTEYKPVMESHSGAKLSLENSGTVTFRDGEAVIEVRQEGDGFVAFYEAGMRRVWWIERWPNVYTIIETTARLCEKINAGAWLPTV